MPAVEEEEEGLQAVANYTSITLYYMILTVTMRARGPAEISRQKTPIMSHVKIPRITQFRHLYCN
jgi:hypothetical protein